MAGTEHQRSFDELGAPLHDVTFCVVDVETTGGSAAQGAITEIGAVLLRGGECLGTFSTLVNPGCAIPPAITVLTGITEAMVLPAPRIEAVLASFLEFAGDAVIVGHNVRYDLGFLNAALLRAGRGRLANRSVDTLALARRLVRDEVPNCKLSTLADSLRLSHQPRHRALDDALATGDLLHLLLERAASWGVLGLDDLLVLPRLGGHPQVAKLALTRSLPRAPGVYIFRDHRGRALYVGKATNLRTRVRSYFSGDERRKVGQLLRETYAIDHQVCHHPLEAAVLEARLLHELLPRFNRQGTTWRRYVYVKLTSERYPRLSLVRDLRSDGALYLGPLTSRAQATLVVEAIQSAVPLRRCTSRVGASPTAAQCTSAQLGVATCPCSGAISEARYAELVDTVRRGLTADPRVLLAPLQQQMRRMADQQRFEEAADVRDRAAALARALDRRDRIDALRAAGTVVVELHGGGGAELRAGRLHRSWGGPELPLPPPTPAPALVDIALPPAAEELDELLCVTSWLTRDAHRLRLTYAERGLGERIARLPAFAAGPTRSRQPRR
jgi:DNA polymerase-3 subunit epsilon